ncbi:hypothetical protein ACTQ9L_02230 [Deinococcus wulumuqiensis]
MKKSILALTILLGSVAYAQDTSTDTTTETTTTETTTDTGVETTDTSVETTDTSVETTDTSVETTDVENDAVTTSSETDGVPGNEREPAGFPWGLLGLLGLAGLMNRGRPQPAPVVHTTTHTEPRRDTTVVTGTTTQNDQNRR